MKFFLLALAVCISGCSKCNESMTQKEKNQKEQAEIERGMKTQCLDGVEYYFLMKGYYNQGYGYMSPKFNKDGTIVTCFDN